MIAAGVIRSCGPPVVLHAPVGTLATFGALLSLPPDVLPSGLTLR